MTPTWTSDDGAIQLYNADCRDVLPMLPNEYADIVWTDPPYGHKNNNGDLIARWEAALGRGKYIPGKTDRPIANDSMNEMRNVVDFALTECSRVLRRDCCCCCCCCCGGGGPKPTFAWLAQRMDTGGLAFFHAVVWDKGGLGMGWRYRRNYEMVMVAHRKGGKLKWEYEGKGPKTANVVRIPKIIPADYEHPTPKPPELVRHFLELHGKPGDLVLDPFMGAGVCGEVAVRMGMKYVGIEIDRHWFEVSVERIQKALNDTPLFDKPNAKQLSMV